MKSEEINVKFIIIMLESHYYKDMVEAGCDEAGEDVWQAAYMQQPLSFRPVIRMPN